MAGRIRHLHPTNETVFFETNKEHMLTDEKLRETEKKVAKMILA